MLSLFGSGTKASSGNRWQEAATLIMLIAGAVALYLAGTGCQAFMEAFALLCCCRRRRARAAAAGPPLAGEEPQLPEMRGPQGDAPTDNVYYGLIKNKDMTERCQTPKERQNRAQEDRRALGDRHFVEIQTHRAPEREACLYSHPMSLRNRSTQVDGPCAATECGVSGDTSANSYYRGCIAIDPNAAVRSHGYYIQNRKSTHGWHRNANRRCSAGGRKQDGGKH